MLNFQILLVHIIGLVIYRCLKKQIQVVYIFNLQIAKNVKMETI